jgi:hypothetical protein
MSLATLSQKDTGSIQFAVVSYQLGFTSQTQSSQFRLGLQHYPIKSLQDDFVFKAQFSSDDALKAAQDFVSNSNNAILNPKSGPAGAPTRFYWPEMKFDYQGFVKAVPLGAKKFDPAPQIQFQMVLCQDSIYTQSVDYTQVDNWTGIYGDYLNTGQATMYNPDAVPLTPPANTSGGGTPAAAPAAATPTAPASVPGSDITNWFSSLFSFL